MDARAILDVTSTRYPVGIGGCHADKNPLDSCEYNVTVFDKDAPDQISRCGDAIIKISHRSLDDRDSDALMHYDQMQIINDPAWELQMLLLSAREKRSATFADYAKNCAIHAMFCCSRVKDSESDVFAQCWQKSALIYLANSILALNKQRPSPAHNLEKLRNLSKGFAADKISIIHDAMGIKRATSLLLERMCKSTIGFSQKVEKNQHSLIIKAKHDYFVKNAMFADCYFYLVCINQLNFIAVKNSLHRNPDLIHILKVAFDLENEPEKLRQNTGIIQRACNDILVGIKDRRL